MLMTTMNSRYELMYRPIGRYRPLGDRKSLASLKFDAVAVRSLLPAKGNYYYYYYFFKPR